MPRVACVAFFAALLAVNACKDDNEAQEEAERGTSCNNVDFQAPGVETQFQHGAAPAATGGTIVPGTYVLTESNIYNADGGVGPTGQTIRRTMVFTADKFDFVEEEGTVAGGVKETEKRTKTYVVKGTSLELATTCPAASGTVLVPYTVDGDKIRLIELNAFTERVFTKK